MPKPASPFFRPVRRPAISCHRRLPGSPYRDVRRWRGRPDRFAAIASFRGDDLATGSPDGPHRCVKDITYRACVAGAYEDTHFIKMPAGQLEQVLTFASVDIYRGGHPGHAAQDHPGYNEATAERHRREHNAQLAETLKR